MPRQARLDAPDTLHHVMVRGIERTALFRDDVDRADFMARVAALADAGALTVFAWALLPNHAHLLVRTGSRPLPRSMRSLLTGYAGAFNRRHKRVGHLFQNRYKSIVVEAESYLLELVRYLHLNPLRAQVVPDLRRLGHYPWTGHSALLRQCAAHLAGHVDHPEPVRADPGPRAGRLSGLRGGRGVPGPPARVPRRRPPALPGGLGRRGRPPPGAGALPGGRADPREHRLRGGDAPDRAASGARATPRMPLPALLARICRTTGIAPAALRQGSRRASVARAREGIAYLAIERYGYPGVALRDWLGVGAPSIVKAAQRGRAAHTHWDPLLVQETNTYKAIKEATSPKSGETMAGAFSFTEWLMQRRKEDTAIGDLARDVAQNTGWQNPETLERLLLLLEGWGACEEARDAARKAWRQFSETTHRARA